MFALKTIARMHVREAFRPDSKAELVIYIVHGPVPPNCKNRCIFRYSVDSEEIATVNMEGSPAYGRHALTPENGNFPVTGIQAAFGTGRTTSLYGIHTEAINE